MRRILVTGAFGQIGTELTRELRRRLGNENVIASGRRLPKDQSTVGPGPSELVDVTDCSELDDVVKKHHIDTIFHLAAILSATGEHKPASTWEVNVEGLRNILDCACNNAVAQVFWPSSIAAFGPGTPREMTPQDTLMRPTTIYGITKVTGELLCDYYCERYGLDVRGVRYPGVISSETLPGGGTTDYAVEIFYEALKRRKYICFVREDTVLPMIYMPDCIRAAIEIMEAERAKLRHRNSFNISGISFSAGELAAEIQKHLPDFVCRFEPDERQAIADSWPKSLDDTAARNEWGWKPHYDLAAMTKEMLLCLQRRRDTGEF